MMMVDRKMDPGCICGGVIIFVALALSMFLGGKMWDAYYAQDRRIGVLEKTVKRLESKQK